MAPHYTLGTRRTYSRLKPPASPRGLFNKESSLRKWLVPNDVFVVDRVFRDSVDLIESIGFQSESPAFLLKGQKQHSAEEANLSRLVTKIRCTVESANGRLKKWRFLSNTVSNTQIPFIGEYVRIVGSLINRYRLPLASDSENDSEIAKNMLEKTRMKEKSLKDILIEPSGRRCSLKMSKVECSKISFPRLSDEYLRSLKFGVYHVKQAFLYSLEHVSPDGGYDLYTCQLLPNILQAKIQSRHTSSKSY